MMDDGSTLFSHCLFHGVLVVAALLFNSLQHKQRDKQVSAPSHRPSKLTFVQVLQDPLTSLVLRPQVLTC
jgi:hypothetical protein